MKVGTVQRDSSVYYKRFLPEDIKKMKKNMSYADIMAYNPLCTDVTMTPQTDLQYILQQNPDINGLSLILDDTKRSEILETVQFEDFVEPSGNYDIFDVQEFMENAFEQFKKLPVSFRMQYGNDPTTFLKNFNTPSDHSKTIAALAEVLSRPVPQENISQSGETTNVVPPTPTPSTDSSAPATSS